MMSLWYMYVYMYLTGQDFKICIQVSVSTCNSGLSFSEEIHSTVHFHDQIATELVANSYVVASLEELPQPY